MPTNLPLHQFGIRARSTFFAARMLLRATQNCQARLDEIMDQEWFIQIQQSIEQLTQAVAAFSTRVPNPPTPQVDNGEEKDMKEELDAENLFTRNARNWGGRDSFQH